MRIYAYLRASTKEQDATRARERVERFITERGHTVAACFVEHESGATLNRPELMRMIDIAQPGDVVAVEQIDRLSRLNAQDWQTLRDTITRKGIRVVALDVPTSHQLLNAGDEFQARMMCAINDMMLDMQAAIARKDYDDRRRRQAEGIASAKKRGVYKGKGRDQKKIKLVQSLFTAGKNKSEIHRLTGMARTTIHRIISEMEAASHD